MSRRRGVQGGNPFLSTLIASACLVAAFPLAAQPQPGLYTVTPCRALDTRNPAGPFGEPALQAGTTRTLALAGTCGTDPNAVAIATNVTVTGASRGVGSSGGKVLADPTVSAGSFNSSLGEASRLQCQVARLGEVRTLVADREGFFIRKMPSVKVTAGMNTVTWDGKDDSGAVVPDDTYTFRLEITDGKVSETYDPARGFVAENQEQKTTYSRESGILSYVLKHPSRVHIQAGEVG